MSKVISCVELVSAIVARKGCQFVGWQVTTELKLSGGKKCPYVGATKTSRISGKLGVDKEREENDALENAGLPRDYVAGPRQWGQRVAGTPFVTHTLKGTDNRKLYISATVDNATIVSYNDCNGNPIAFEDIEPWIVKREYSEVNYSDYSLASVAIVYRKVNKEDKETTPHVVDHSDIDQAVTMF